jgi:hypothetical protein
MAGWPMDFPPLAALRPGMASRAAVLCPFLDFAVFYSYVLPVNL